MNKALLFKLIRLTGLPLLLRETWQRRRVTILMFHDIDEAGAKQAFNFLRSKYNIISLKEFVEACQTHPRRPLPEKALIITFDDGHIGNYELLPVIRDLAIPVTIFLCAGIIDTRRHFWFTFHPNGNITEELKTMPNTERLKILKKLGYTPEQEFEEPQALSRAQLQEMRNEVDFQAHTVFHPCLPTCEAAEARREMVDAKNILEQEFGLAVYAVAFPNGDYTDRELALAKEAGYRCAVTVDPGYNTLDADLFRLKRFSVNDTRNLDELAVKASGFWGIFKKLLHSIIG